MRMQRCFTSGKLLDLTNGTIGIPDCVDQCAPPGERTIQAEGVGFCMLPVARKDAFDVSFAVQLRNISLRKLPPTDWIRMSLPVAVGQALQVAPSDVPLELMIRDASMYDNHVLRSFKLRRKDEVEPEPAGLEAFELQQKQRVQEAEVSDQVPEEGEMPKASNISGSTRKVPSMGSVDPRVRGGQKQRPKRVSVAYGPCRSGSCNLYVAVRCEVWRLPNKDGDMLPDSPLLQALQDRAAGEVGRLLGLVGNWSLVDVSLTERPRHASPLEVAHAEPAFRFDGFPWNYDPLHGNMTGRWNEIGADIDPRLRMEEKGLEQLLIGFFVLMALIFAVLGQQRLALTSSHSLTMADRSADWHAVGGLGARTFRRPWPMKRETKKMLGMRTA